MNRRSFIFAVAVLATSLMTAQPAKRCGTQPPPDAWEQEITSQVAQYINSRGLLPTNTQYVIPVIIHVLHGGQPVGTYPNLANGQLVSQIQVLNDDFGGIGFKRWAYHPAAFTNFAQQTGVPAASKDAAGRIAIANTGIQFCLATMNPTGGVLAEPGVDRINLTTQGWTNPATFTSTGAFMSYMDGTVKPGSIWDVTKYLNIWVSDINLSVVSILGYASFPPSSTLPGLGGSPGTSTTDGVWCYSRCFGSALIYPSGTYNGGNDRGRTSTHEIGHYLGLRHTWGDNGQCGGTDYCPDTPPQRGGSQTTPGANYGAPTYPLNAGLCTRNDGVGNASLTNLNGDMFMNFMDYPDDQYLWMFTQDQTNRIQTVMLNSPNRKFLGTHNLCSVAPVPAAASFSVVAAACGSAVVTLSNSSIGTPVPSFQWSVSNGGTFFPNNTEAVTVTFSTTGTYTISLTANNGTTSAVTKTVTVYPYPTVTVTSGRPLYCFGDSVELTASGTANSYIWQPDFKLGSTVKYFGTADETYTVYATGAGNCKTLDTIRSKIVDCTGLMAIGSAGGQFEVYPNPAHEFLYVKNRSKEPVEFVITDLTGRVMASRILAREEERIDIRSLPEGVYIASMRTASGLSDYKRIIRE